VSEDPFRVTVTISGGTESVSVDFDEEMTVLGVDRPAAKAAD
jgi:hypothetical protein